MAVAPRASQLDRARRLLAAGALAITLGLLVAGTVSPDVGGVALLAGWLMLVAGLHFFGRAGSARAL